MFYKICNDVFQSVTKCTQVAIIRAVYWWIASTLHALAYILCLASLPYTCTEGTLCLVSGPSSSQLFSGDSTCRICFKTFYDSSNLRTHFRVTHSNIRFQCQHCFFLLRHKHCLKYHLRSKHGFDTKFPCPRCSKSLASFHAYEEHLDIVHHVSLSNKMPI